jgi:hypothetical protein
MAERGLNDALKAERRAGAVHRGLQKLKRNPPFTVNGVPGAILLSLWAVEK